MDINRTTLNDLYVGYKGHYQRGLRSRATADAWRRIATLIPSMTAKEVYPWLGQWPKMREWLGDRVIKQLAAHRYEIKNKPFETTVEVERETIEDDSFGVYGPLFEELGIAVAEWPSEVVFAVLKLGETALGYDGVPFFSATHPHELAGNVSNLGAGAAAPWYLLDTTRALKPLIWQLRKQPNFVRKDQETDENVFHRKTYIYGVDARGNAGFGLWQLAYKSKATLDEAGLIAALQALREMTNDEGSDLGITPNLLVVPPELEIPAKKLVTAAQNASGATNVLSGLAEVYVTNLVRE